MWHYVNTGNNLLCHFTCYFTSDSKIEINLSSDIAISALVCYLGVLPFNQFSSDTEPRKTVQAAV